MNSLKIFDSLNSLHEGKQISSFLNATIGRAIVYLGQNVVTSSVEVVPFAIEGPVMRMTSDEALIVARSLQAFPQTTSRAIAKIEKGKINETILNKFVSNELI